MTNWGAKPRSSPREVAALAADAASYVLSALGTPALQTEPEPAPSLA
ncbi:hypothetical protein ACGFNV_35435 [Streptomyces sp. NPDC048751]